ncbi:hypothetical protein [Streptomyces sp. NPDC057579]|uniref:hypothetical protein n=1 Tax=Streptomyces sp. NPDC057579 TaxID=3346172 RepID=UPI0036857380
MSTDTPAMTSPASSITQAAAGALIAAVHTAAARIGFTAAVAVTDPGGHLKAFDRPARQRGPHSIPVDRSLGKVCPSEPIHRI